MKAIIAEKPSVARDIARLVGANSKKDGYLEGNGYMVTWAFGHLIQLAMPDAYGIEGFRKENLPIIPEHFKHIVTQKKSGKEFKPDSSAVKQLKVIKQVFEDCDSIIVATDAGREGELIFRLIYRHLNCHKPFERLWISSLTDRAIKDGMNNLLPGTDYDNLYKSALARSEADWLVGINATQALSIAAGKGVFSLGRVQTPTLSMICKRFIENRDFVPSKYWRIKATFNKFNQSVSALSDEKWYSSKSVKEALSSLADEKEIIVDSIEEKEVCQEPPLLYDLTSLQKEANTKLNLSAEKTLSIVQGLYEKKFLTYPRTGSRYISEDLFAEIPSRIKLLEKYSELSEYAVMLEDQDLNRKSVDDSKITDHHALIVTENLPHGLTNDEKAIYELVASRMLEAFMDKCRMVKTTVKLSVGEIKFQLKGSQIKVMGWKVVRFEEDKDSEEEESSNLPEFYQGEKLPIEKLESIEKQTKPKPLLNEASLLSSMETAGKEIEDVELRESIKDCGIGTPATRANIIETLLAREYVKRQKKNLVPTEKGMAVYDIVKNMEIANVEMTGNWEKQLAEIEKGDVKFDEFMDGIKNYTVRSIAELLNVKLAVEMDSPYICPKCQTGRLKIYPKVVKCNNKECDLLLFRTLAGKQISDTHVEQLLKKGKTTLIKGFKNKAGKPFDAYVILGDDYRFSFQFPERK